MISIIFVLLFKIPIEIIRKKRQDKFDLSEFIQSPVTLQNGIFFNRENGTNVRSPSPIQMIHK